MATKQLTASDTYVLPRVNLLPPEIGQRRADRKSYAFMGIAGAGALAAVVAMYLGQASRVSSAKSELQRAQTENSRLKNERQKLQPVQDVYLQVDAQEALVTRAYANRVLWSVYMHNIAISVPDNVWITQFAGTVGAAGAPVAGSTTAAVGTLTFAGKAFVYDDVAAWLDSIAKIKGVANATFSTASKLAPTTPGARSIVTFASTATLTPTSLTPHTKSGSR